MNVRLIIIAAVAAAAAAAAIVFNGSISTRRLNSGEKIDDISIAGLQKIGDAAAASSKSTIAAFAATAVEEREELDSRAIADIERLGQIFAENRPKMSLGAADLAMSIVERHEAAQVQLMSFAINRKNRESAEIQSPLENEDRQAFERDSTDLGARLRDAISTKRLR